MELIDKRELIVDITKKKYESLKDITDYHKRLQKSLQYSGFMSMINRQPVVLNLEDIIKYLEIRHYNAKREYSEARDNLANMTKFNRKYKSERYRMDYNQGVFNACNDILNLLSSRLVDENKED